MKTSSEAADVPSRPRKLFPIFLACSLPGALLLKAGFFLLVIGMAPTFLAAAAVRTRRSHIVSTVAAFNFAGVFPELLGLSLEGGSPRALMDALMDPSVWVSMYGAALLGWAFVWLSPGMAMILLESVYRSRMRHLESQQKKLEEEWGPQIRGEEQT